MARQLVDQDKFILVLLIETLLILQIDKKNKLYLEPR
jgi:hypothetical protein